MGKNQNAGRRTQNTGEDLELKTGSSWILDLGFIKSEI
jgi:hypothetical protein